jgi:hypothetical protein
MLIDDAFSVDKNVVKKEAERTLKYNDLTTDMQHMWNVKTKVITVIIEATNHFRIIQNLNNIPRKLDNRRIQTTATPGTAQVLRKVLT